MWDNNTPKHVPTHTRKKILARDNHTCQHCGTTNPPLEVDHIDNTRGPGYNKETNLQTLCKRCHNKKTQQEAAAARNRWKRRREPHPGAPQGDTPPHPTHKPPGGHGARVLCGSGGFGGYGFVWWHFLRLYSL